MLCFRTGMPRENIVLIGFMGSGKSAIGRRISSRLGFQFIDTDQLIIERTGIPISEIFVTQGEAAFRDLETTVLGTLTHLDRCVVATGGGVVLREENCVLLHQIGLVIGLTASEEVLYNRVSRNTKRPLLQTEDPRETLRQLLEQRLPIYEAAADITIDTSHLSHEEALEAIVIEARYAFAWHRDV